MNFTRLNQRIKIERQQWINDENGATGQEWVEVCEVWASVNNLHGKEYWEAYKYEMQNNLEIVIRYSACPDISVTDRIRWKGRLFNVNYVDNYMYKNETLKLLVSEVTHGNK